MLNTRAAPARYGAPQHVQPSSQCRVKTWEESKGEISGVGADAASDAAVRRELEVRICREAAKAFPVRTPRVFSASSHAHHPPATGATGATGANSANSANSDDSANGANGTNGASPVPLTPASCLPPRTGSRPLTLAPVHVPVVRRGLACHGAPRQTGRAPCVARRIAAHEHQYNDHHQP